MSTTPPSVRDLTASFLANLQSSLGQTIPTLARSFLSVLSKTMAAVFVILYKYIGYTQKQQYVATADFNETDVNGQTVRPLVLWGELIGIGSPTPATRAELEITVTVTNQVGSLPSGTQFINTTTGVVYTSLAIVNLDAATVTVPVRAVSDQSGGGGVGTIGNMDPGDPIQFAVPLSNVVRTAVVASQTQTAADAESEAAYRQRVIDRFQKLPQGGAYADYELWAEEVPGIINAYPYTSNTPGEVDVYVEATPESSGDPDGIPTAAQIQDVLDSINQADRRPANALVRVYGITRTGFDIEIQGLVVNDSSLLPQIQSDITTAVEQWFSDLEPFIDGLTIPPRKDQITNSAVAGLVDDIVQLYGGFFERVVVNLAAVPQLLYILSEGEKAKASSVTFTSV